MTVRDQKLDDVLTPLRDLHLADLLERTAKALDDGWDVVAEPFARDPCGVVLRNGFMHLPVRHDLELRRGRAVEHRVVDTPLELAFDALDIRGGDGFTLAISPFQWQACELVLEARRTRPPEWKPLRLWFLEWSQSRYGEESPDLLGVLHALGDPVRDGRRMSLTLDFGSAPVDAVEALIGALSETGVRGAMLRHAPDATIG